MSETHAILDLMGAGCTSCAYALEKTGRKVPGVTDIRVDIASSEIHVSFDDAEPGAPGRVIELVNRIGHDAVRVDGDCQGPCATCQCEDTSQGKVS